MDYLFFPDSSLIIWQIENEFGPVEYEIGQPGQLYTNWTAEMAVAQSTGIPWVMCKQDDAPDPIVSISELDIFFSSEI